MEITEFKEWIVPVSTCITMITVAVGAWLALKEFRIKIRAELRLEKSAEAESDIRLLKLFSEFMNVANGRSGYSHSDAAISWYLSNHKAPKNNELLQINQELEDLSIITLPVGAATQNAAITAIYSLAEKHEILRVPAIEAMDRLLQDRNSSKVVRKYSTLLRLLLNPQEDNHPENTELSKVHSYSDVQKVIDSNEAKNKFFNIFLLELFQQPNMVESLEEGKSIEVTGNITSGLSQTEIESVIDDAVKMYISIVAIQDGLA